MDFGAVLRMMLALIATLGILGLLAYGAKRFDILALFNGEQKQPGAQAKTLAEFFTRSAQAPKRLQIVEQRMLDARTRLMVVRWDDVEHLILVGSEGETIASKPAPPPPSSAAPSTAATISGGAA